MCLATSKNFLLVLYDAQKNRILLPCTRDLLISRETMQRHFFFFSILHHLSPVILANAAVSVFLLLHNSSFNFHCYAQREATPTQKSAQNLNGSCDVSRLLARKITKGIHSCKPASLNCPTGTVLFSLRPGGSFSVQCKYFKLRRFWHCLR